MKKVGIFLYYTGKSLMYLDPEVIDCNIFYLVQVCSTFGRFLIKILIPLKEAQLKQMKGKLFNVTLFAHYHFLLGRILRNESRFQTVI